MTLVIMAAGMGSRFGGLKQIEPVGPNGEFIIDYSIYDAIKAGFGKVVFIIKHAIEEDFKIYQYNPYTLGDAESEDIKITLKRINLKFSFRVYLDLKKFEKLKKIPDGYDDIYTGYEWRSDIINSELLIKKDDPHYSKTGPYYIVVVKDFDSSEVEKDSIASFYLDVTTKSSPLQLKEGLEHATVLNEDYKYQTYWYTHYNMENSFELNLNIFTGMVNVYISNDSFDVSDLKNFGFKDKLVFYEEYVHTSTTYNITTYDLNKACPDKNRCELFIFIQKASTVYDTDYLIVGKSSTQIMEILTPGLVKQGQVLKGQAKYYYVEEMTKRQATALMVHFEGGTGEVYVRIPGKN